MLKNKTTMLVAIVALAIGVLFLTGLASFTTVSYVDDEYVIKASQDSGEVTAGLLKGHVELASDAYPMGGSDVMVLVSNVTISFDGSQQYLGVTPEQGDYVNISAYVTLQDHNQIQEYTSATVPIMVYQYGVDIGEKTVSIENFYSPFIMTANEDSTVRAYLFIKYTGELANTRDVPNINQEGNLGEDTAVVVAYDATEDSGIETRDGGWIYAESPFIGDLDDPDPDPDDTDDTGTDSGSSSSSSSQTSTEGSSIWMYVLFVGLIVAGILIPNLPPWGKYGLIIGGAIGIFWQLYQGGLV